MNETSIRKSTRRWWEKPGFGIMYQIEARPGWIWDRDFDKFNESMKDEYGKINFNGPFCKMKDWVAYSERVGVDYHIFEAKWHDGICYFDTQYTEWKTPEDYCKIFSEQSKKARIPFMFYYSSVFDHNPQFDSIQPIREFTPSYLALHRENGKEVAKFSLGFTQMIITLAMAHIMEQLKNHDKQAPSQPPSFEIKVDRPYSTRFFKKKMKEIEENDIQFNYNPEKYETYLKNQLSELIEKYDPDGMWMDWFMKEAIREGSTILIMDLMKEKYPNVILTFNNSVNEKVRYCQYLSGEAHTVESAWDQGNKLRNKTMPWELVGPAAKNWFDPNPREDPFEIGRIAAIIMASGGKYCFGLPSQMDGSLYPEPSTQVEAFGKWYEPRRDLFTEAIPMNYKRKKVPGVKLDDENFGIIGSQQVNDRILHVINLTGIQKFITIELESTIWAGIKKIILEPNGIKLDVEKIESNFCVEISKENLDKIDTILRIV